MRKHLRLIALIVLVLGLALGNRSDVFAASGPQATASTPAATLGGTVIVNTASATYDDLDGATYSTVSNTVETTVAMIGSLVVSPKKAIADPATDGAPAGSVVRSFVIANTSNISDAYTITAATHGPAALTSVAFRGGIESAPIPVTVGTTVSPAVAPGGSIEVIVTVDTTGIAVGTQIPIAITAQTTTAGTTNGLQADSGKQWIVMAKGADIVGPGGPNSRISKTVDRTSMVQSQPGSTVTFDIVATNSGGSTATDVVVTDAIPAGLTANLPSVVVKIDGAAVPFTSTLVEGTLTVRTDALPAGSTLDLSFDCTVLPGDTIGMTFVNVATVSAQGIPNLGTTPASVMTGSADEVFDGYGGGRVPVGGATVTLLDENDRPVLLASGNHVPASAGALANTQNPFVTSADGTYGFSLDPASVVGPKHWTLTVSAPNYLNRRIALDLTPGAGDPLYNVKVTSLDGQPLATAGGFSLTNTDVSIDNIFGFFGNLPLFRVRTLVVTKTVDRQVAQPGDRLVYTIDIANTSPSTIAATQIVDTLPAGLAYAPGTAKLDGVALEPAVDGRTLTWTVPAVAPSSDHSLTYVCVVYPSVSSGTELVNSVGVTGLVPGTNVTTHADSTVSVQIVGGAFSQRQIITGRVFIDTMRSGRFRRGDSGVAGVRVFLEDGSSVVTDVDGRFSFPGARPGMHVLRVDATTLPLGVRAYEGYPVTSSRSLQQLVHGILDDGLIEDVEFAMAPQ